MSTHRPPIQENLEEGLAGGPDCVLWRFSLNYKGYGSVTYNGRARLAHRVVWLMNGGLIPDGYTIDHVCHNPQCDGDRHCDHRRCINIDHLRLATVSEQNRNKRR